MTIEHWRGKEPHKSFSGRFTVSRSPAQHKKVIMAAEKAGKNLDSWIAETLLQAAQ